MGIFIHDKMYLKIIRTRYTTQKNISAEEQKQNENIFSRIDWFSTTKKLKINYNLLLFSFIKRKRVK